MEAYTWLLERNPTEKQRIMAEFTVAESKAKRYLETQKQYLQEYVSMDCDNKPCE